jgi:hypothetical protein
MPSLHHFRPIPDDALPPGEIRFSEFRVEPWPDGRRIRVHLTLTPFQQNPNLDVVLTDAGGQVIASTAIIETAENRMVFTMHIRSPQTAGEYSLSSSVSYPEIGVVDQQTISFEIRQSAGGEA